MVEELYLEKSKMQTKLTLMFLDVKVLRENKQFRLWTFSTNKEGTVYVFTV